MTTNDPKRHRFELMPKYELINKALHLQAELDKAKKILMAIEDRATVNFDNALLAYIRTLKERNENE